MRCRRVEEQIYDSKGDPNRVWMPREWLREDADVQVLVEALKKGAELTSLQVDYR